MFWVNEGLTLQYFVDELWLSATWTPYLTHAYAPAHLSATTAFRPPIHRNMVRLRLNAGEPPTDRRKRGQVKIALCARWV